MILNLGGGISLLVEQNAKSHHRHRAEERDDADSDQASNDPSMDLILQSLVPALCDDAERVVLRILYELPEGVIVSTIGFSLVDRVLFSRLELLRRSSAECRRSPA